MDKDKYNYPQILFCPVCGKRTIKENGAVTFRCRTCDTEFVLWIQFDPKENRNYFFDQDKCELNPDYYDTKQKREDERKLQKQKEEKE